MKILIFFFFFIKSFNKLWCEPELFNYKPLEDSDIILLQVITRHGARTPLHLSQVTDHLWKCNNTEYLLFKENNFNPFKIHIQYGKSLIGNNCIFGQLVDRGYIFLNKFGLHLKTIYIDYLKFLPIKMNLKTLSIRSTLTHRTINSAISLINGMYNNHPDLPIFTADKDLDPWRRSSLVCPNLKKRIDLMRESKEFLNYFAENNTIAKKAAISLNMKPKAAPDVAMASRCNGISLPPGTNDYYLDYAAILKAKQQEKLFSNETIFPLAFSIPMSEILNTMIERISGNSNIRFKLWSGHNGNILGFLGYLGISFDILPPYGSYILIELLKLKKTQKFILRFNYNGKFLSIPRFKNKEIIPFNDFYLFVKNHIPSLEECGFDLEKLKESIVLKGEDK